jgi:hypothetical protein
MINGVFLLHSGRVNGLYYLRDPTPMHDDSPMNYSPSRAPLEIVTSGLMILICSLDLQTTFWNNILLIAGH